jgi:hypothetical protein
MAEYMQNQARKTGNVSKVHEYVSIKLAAGMVLDFKGNWVPVSQLASTEDAILKHLEAGEVLCDGVWVSIEKCLKSRPAGGNSENPDSQHISNKKSSPWMVVSCETGEHKPVEPGMMSIIHQAGELEGETGNI